VPEGDDRPATAAAQRYSIVLPPGWAAIPLRSGTSNAVREILDASFRGLPMDKYGPHRHELERRLYDLINEARRNNGIDLYLPVELMHGLPVSASFVVSEVSFGATEPIDPALVVAKLAADGDESGVVSVDGAMAARSERIVTGDAAQGTEYATRRVTYIVAVPGDADRWLSVAFSTPGAGNPEDNVSKLLVQLFDAMMATFRWGQQ
jgi:hypothetical protein